MAESVAVSADSRTVFVTGWAEASSTSYDWVTFAYDASTGGTDWLARFDSPAHASDYAYAVGVTPDDSKVVVTGTVFVGPASQYDSATLVYAARTGSRLSVETYGGSANGLDQSYALAVSPVGNRVYSAGTTWDGDASNYDYLTIAYRVA